MSDDERNIQESEETLRSSISAAPARISPEDDNMSPPARRRDDFGDHLRLPGVSIPPGIFVVVFSEIRKFKEGAPVIFFTLCISLAAWGYSKYDERRAVVEVQEREMAIKERQRILDIIEQQRADMAKLQITIDRLSANDESRRNRDQVILDAIKRGHE
jgi:hypothetical protein